PVSHAPPPRQGRVSTARFAAGSSGWSWSPFAGKISPGAPDRQAVEVVVDRFAELLERLGFLYTELPHDAAGSPEAAIRSLIGCLVKSGTLQADQAEDAIRRVLARERLGSTAI